MLSVTFRPELVALVAGPTDPSPYRARGSRCSRAGSAIRMLTVLLLGRSCEMGSVNSDVLLEVL